MDNIEDISLEPDEYDFEKNILDFCDDDFGYQIKERGRYYYNMGNVLSCYKVGNSYYAKVQGSSADPYKVIIQYDDCEYNYSCNCPYDAPCKHEYATLMAISNGEYSSIELKPDVEKSISDIQDIIASIPADKLKEFLLSPESLNTVHYNKKFMEKYFQKYFPKQDYDYYYNNLYNCLILDNNYTELLDDFLESINNYIYNDIFDEGFKIIKCIIEAYNDTKLLNSDNYIISKLPQIGMFLRVIYRKANKNLKSEISRYIDLLSSNKFYNNYYLEDIIIQIGN